MATVLCVGRQRVRANGSITAHSQIYGSFERCLGLIAKPFQTACWDNRLAPEPVLHGDVALLIEAGQFTIYSELPR